jgi:hypothetical protein
VQLSKRINELQQEVMYCMLVNSQFLFEIYGFKLFIVGGGIDMVLPALKELFSRVDFVNIDAVLT